MKVLAFRLFGDFAHFRAYYSTSSPTTYSLVPPTSIMGVLGAILGLSKYQDQYYDLLTEKETLVGVHLDNPVSKMMMSTNLINTKNNYWVPTGRNSSGPRTPTRFEYVRKPEYLIYVTMKDEGLLVELADRIKKHCLSYTVSLGLANLIADVTFEFYEEAVPQQAEGYQTMDCAVPLSALADEKPIHIEPDIQYCKERYVEYFLRDRVPGGYVDVLFSMNGKKITVKPSKYYEAGGRKFLFMNETL